MKNDLKNIYYGVSQKYKIDDKAGDITAGTPFVELTSDYDDTKIYLNVYKIIEVVAIGNTTHVYTTCNTIVKETPAEILELIKNKYKGDK